MLSNSSWRNGPPRSLSDDSSHAEPRISTAKGKLSFVKKGASQQPYTEEGSTSKNKLSLISKGTSQQVAAEETSVDHMTQTRFLHPLQTQKSFRRDEPSNLRINMLGMGPRKAQSTPFFRIISSNDSSTPSSSQITPETSSLLSTTSSATIFSPTSAELPLTPTPKWQSYWDRKERTYSRKDVPVPAFWIAPGAIFHTPIVAPEDSVANEQCDSGWWGHPILILSYDRVKKLADVLLVTTLAGRSVEQSYKPGVTMRRRLLYLDGSGKSSAGNELMPTLRVAEGFNNMYGQSFVKINRPVTVERRYILHLGMARSVKIDVPSMEIVDHILKRYMETEVWIQEANERAMQASGEELAEVEGESGYELEDMQYAESVQSLSEGGEEESQHAFDVLSSGTHELSLGSHSPSAVATREQWQDWGNATVCRMGSIGSVLENAGSPGEEEKTESE